MDVHSVYPDKNSLWRHVEKNITKRVIQGIKEGIDSTTLVL